VSGSLNVSRSWAVANKMVK